MKKLYILVFTLTCTAMLSSCATIFTRSKYQVSITSTPSDASVSIENRQSKTIYTGTTPTVVKLKSAAGYMKREEYKITFTKEGYAPKTIFLTANLDGWYIGNVLIGGLIGWLIIDPASGAMYRIAPEDRDIHEQLDPTPKNEMSLHITDMNALPNNLKSSKLIAL